jgi:hypothetical protein
MVSGKDDDKNNAIQALIKKRFLVDGEQDRIKASM